MSVTSDILTTLKTRIAALPSVQKVYAYHELEPEGWPAVWILPFDLDGTFATTTENKRASAFRITALMELGQDYIKNGSIVRENKADQVLGQVVDEIINDLDTNTFRSTFVDLSEGNSEFVYAEAADVAWGVVQTPVGFARAVEMTLIINYYYNVRSS